MIREEWEALERKEKGATEKKDKNKSKKEVETGHNQLLYKSPCTLLSFILLFAFFFWQALLAEALSEIDQTMQEQGTLLDVHVVRHMNGCVTVLNFPQSR